MNARDALKISRTLFNAVLARSSLLQFSASQAGAGGSMRATSNRRTTSPKQNGEIGTLQRDSDWILAKLDQILRELRARR